MSSRMEKYNNTFDPSMSRTKKNNAMYSSLDISELSRIKTNNNVSVISDAAKEIDIEKIKKYIYTINEDTEEKRRRISFELPKEEEKKIERQEVKNYDINAVLERARGNKETDYETERYRKLNNTGYDILKEIKVQEENKEVTEPIDELNTGEKTIVDLIQTIVKNKKDEDEEDLFGELMGNNDNTVVLAPIEEEIKKNEIKQEIESITQELETFKKPIDDATQDLLLEEASLKALEEKEPKIEKIDTTLTNTDKMSEIDKSFFSNSMSFSKEDFEGFDELEWLYLY